MNNTSRSGILVSGAVLLLLAFEGYKNTVHPHEFAPPAKPAAHAEAAEHSSSEGNWGMRVDTNPVTGETTKTVALRYHEPQNIIVRQIGKKLDCFINTDEFLETVENIDSRRSMVQYKFDGGKVIRQAWIISSDNEALFYPGDPRPFLARLRQAHTLYFEYRPADKVPDTLTLDVTGFPNVFEQKTR